MALLSSAAGYASTTAVGAGAFVDSIGVNTHFSYTDTAYANVGAAGAALAYMGVDLVRDYLPASKMGPYVQLAQAGVRFDFFFPGDGNIGNYLSTLTGFAQTFPGQIAAIEGPNEVNFWPVNWNGLTDLASQAAVQQTLFSAVNANPVLANIPVYNLTLGGVGESAFRQLGDLSGAADYANVHMYFGAGGPPVSAWAYALSLGQIAKPGSLSAITETGYSTAVNNSQGVDETTQAKYILDLLMDSAKAGSPGTYLYELVDQRNDASRSDKELNFGLFHADWTAKVAASAIHNLTTILTNEAGATTPGAALAYNVSGLPPATGQHMVFQENAGVWDIVVWAEPDIWDEAARRAITVDGHQVTISLPASATGYLVYDPMQGPAPIASGGPTSQITVTVTDHPIIIELRSDGAPIMAAAAPWAFPTVAGGTTDLGTTGNDVLTGAAASDTLRGGDGADSISGGGAFDDLNGNVGADTVFGGAGNDWVLGGKDNDQVSGDDGDDIVNGNIGADLVLGGAGNDTVRGGQDNDSVSGGTGADWLSGDRGDDTISGGAGADVFHSSSGAGVDRVLDFSSAEGDRVQLDPGTAYTLRFVGGDTVIDMGAGDQLVLVGVAQSALGDWLIA